MKTPWHLWVIGIVSLLWNAGGAYDYVMMRTQNTAYTAQLTAEQLAFYDNYPFLVSLAWAIGVWGAVVGSVLLLLRSRFAVQTFALSLAGMLGNFVWGLLFSPTPMTMPSANAGAGPILFTVAIFVVAVLLFVYALRMAQRGVLR